MSIRIYKTTSATPPFTVPMVYHSVFDGSVVPGFTASVGTGVLFTPIYTEKGPTDVVKYFNGATAAADLVRTFGNPNTRKLGLPYTAAVEHAGAGGHVVVLSIKHETATMAGFITNLVIDQNDAPYSNGAINPAKKVLGWILSDGSGFVADPYASNSPTATKPTANHTVHSITSKRIYFETIKVSEINSVDELEALVQTMYDTESGKQVPDAKRAFPLVWGLYKGKGSYGNNYAVHWKNINRTVSGRPYFAANIYDKRNDSYEPLTEQPVSLNSDKLDVVPLFIQRRYNQPYSSGDFYMNTLDNEEMNFIGSVIQKELKKLVLFPNGVDTAGDEAKDMNLRLSQLQDDYNQPDDEDYHRLCKLDPTNVTNLNEFTIVTKLSTSQFSGGNEGVLSDLPKRGFNWAHTYNVAPAGQPVQNEKVLQNMFVKAYQGFYSGAIFDLIANPADYIIDMGYPLEVKKAMATYAEGRDDTQILFNAPLESNSPREAIAFKQMFDVRGRNIYYFPGSFKYVDTRIDKTFDVPQSFSVMFLLVEHYKEGFSNPIAGIERGPMKYVEAGSAKGFGQMIPETNQALWNAGYNICSTHTEGLVYLDSQRANYLLTEYSSLQEFHNNSIINRMIKKLYLSLQYEKHRLTSPESVARIVQKINNELRSEFESKVKEVNYNGYFVSAYTEAIGQMEHEIGCRFFNTIKQHHINIKALPVG